ncbi:signal peptidase I [Lactiplantibacillus plantarum subsp. plantarum]|nr:signal peptidase I [Lactiplantibacillus plantarum subsp. plantarum]
MKTFKSIMSWVVPIAIGLIIALLIRQFWFTMVKVDGTSMQPNLQNNERVVAFKTSKIKAGSVVVFTPTDSIRTRPTKTPFMLSGSLGCLGIRSATQVPVNFT